MLLTLRHYIGFLGYAVDVLRYVALNVVNLRCLVVIHWSFQSANIILSILQNWDISEHNRVQPDRGKTTWGNRLEGNVLGAKRLVTVFFL